MSVRMIVCVLSAWMLSPVPSWAQAAGGDAAKAEPRKPAAPGKGTEQANAAWAEAGAVGENHGQLQKKVGAWTVETKAWMGPGPPQVSSGTAEYRSTMGGRFVIEEFAGTVAGKPFLGHGIEGYDNVKKRFVSVWIDSMSTAIRTGEGTAGAGGVTTMTMTSLDPATRRPATLRMVTRWEGDDRFVEEFFAMHGDKEVKTMEIAFTRKASAAK